MKLSKKSARLLTVLVKALRNPKLNKDAFNMGCWAIHAKPKTPELNCGTQCCAIGLASTLSEWKMAGLRIWWEHGEGIPMFDSVAGFEAILELLRIGYGEAKYLFHPDMHKKLRPSPRIVARRIENFVRKHS